MMNASILNNQVQEDSTTQAGLYLNMPVPATDVIIRRNLNEVRSTESETLLIHYGKHNSSPQITSWLVNAADLISCNSIGGSGGQLSSLVDASDTEFDSLADPIADHVNEAIGLFLSARLPTELESLLPLAQQAVRNSCTTRNTKEWAKRIADDVAEAGD
jgi:hypothetical protein